MIKAVSPYLNFPGNTEEAFSFYHSVLGGELVGPIRFRDFPEDPMGVPEEELDRIANIGLALGNGTTLMGTDVISAWRDGFVVGTNSYIHLEVDGADEAERVFDGLSAGGAVEMALTRTEWAEKYGTCRDRFGVQWMISYTGSVVFGA
jgi:PhnB protein